MRKIETKIIKIYNNMTKDFVVAIELGSSKMTGIAGKKNSDGSINVLAFSQEDSSAFIRKGYVYNIDKTALAISNIVRDLSNQLKTEITKVYVGIGGQSVRSIKSKIVRNLPFATKITTAMLDDLMDTNRLTQYPEQEIMDVAVQEYQVDNQMELDPVGIPCSRFEGNFQNVVYRRTFFQTLKNCFAMAGVRVEEFLLSPLALADIILTDTEKRVGCVLVDLGADTTTVAVYSRNILRHLAVIPLGGSNITRDIASQQMDEVDAESMKLRYAKAYTDSSEINVGQKYPIDVDRSIDESLFIKIVEARVEEIIRNVIRQVPQECEGHLLGGYILTGGGSNLKQIERAFANFTNSSKIRIAKTLDSPIFTKISRILGNDGSLNTIIGLLAKGRENCAGNDIDTSNLFAHELKEPVVVEEPKVEQLVPPVPNVVVEEPDDEGDDDSDEKSIKKSSPNVISNLWKFIKGIASEEE